MTIAGVAIRTRRTNSLIDQFRDRVVFPITDPPETSSDSSPAAIRIPNR